VKEVLGAAQARVRSTVHTPVNTLEVIPRKVPTPQPDSERRVPRRYPPPTD
jgi:hypothetical protein